MSSPSPSSSPPSSPASPRPISDDDKPPSQPKPSEPTPPPPPTRNPAFPSREDCWSEEATRTLIDAWGSHYLQLNRGNLRQKHWQEVADAVNAVHATSAKLRRTDVQCKNRIDTTKKKYKIEKSKAIQSNGRYVSTWPHFESLDSLIGDSFSKPNPAAANGHNRNLRRRASHSPEPSPSPPPPPESAPHRRKISPATNHRDTDLVSNPLPRLPWSVPVGPRSKRSGPGSVTERNFSVMAAAAAAMEAEEDEDDCYGDDNDDEDSGAWLRRPPQVGRKRRKGPVGDEQARIADGYRRLAEAISRLGQIYKKVEEAKQQQMVELEKQRMQFAKDLEIQRMKVFMESQVELEKLKRAKGNSEDSNFF